MDFSPIELLYEISRHLESEDLRTLRIVDKRWKDVASRDVFRILRFRTTLQGAMGLKKILERKSLCRYVEALVLREESEQTQTHEQVESCTVAWRFTLSLLGGIANLHSLSFHFAAMPKGSDHEHDASLISRVQHQRSMLQCLVDNHLPYLTFLTVLNLLPLQTDVWASPYMTTIVAQLKRFRIHIAWDPAITDELDAFYDMLSSSVLQPAARLRSLSLGSSGPASIGGTPQVNFPRLVYPHLASLTLTNVLFSETRDLQGGPVHRGCEEAGAEDFIVRCRRTLKHLELRDCRMVVGYCRREIPRRTWTQVWDRFSGELGTLRSLVVAGEGYCYFDGCTYALLPRHVDGAESDQAALRELRWTLDRR